MKKIIALDADGVLLDYHAAYRNAWFRAFNEMPALKDANAYWPIDRWCVRRLAGEELKHFQSFFDEYFWRTVPALPGAVDACIRLQKAGYELICVSALEKRFEYHRLENLLSEGFPISRVIATSNEDKNESPKAACLKEMAPIAFVDDFLPYHRLIPEGIHRALVLRESSGSPNCGDEMNLVHSIHTNLATFADWWIAGRGDIA